VIKHLVLYITLGFSVVVSAQEVTRELPSDDSKYLTKKQQRILRKEAKEAQNLKSYNALAPTKAAFYSAIIPGLGQAYNKQYWKIPVVYAAIGTGIGISVWNHREYTDLRAIYKNRLLGIFNDRFYDIQNKQELVSTDAIVNAMENFEKQRELSVLITVGLYALNIIDANVTAHLQQFNVNDNLSIRPNIQYHDVSLKPNYSLSLNYSF